jgi:hypothetical protein
VLLKKRAKAKAMAKDDNLKTMSTANATATTTAGPPPSAKDDNLKTMATAKQQIAFEEVC